MEQANNVEENLIAVIFEVNMVLMILVGVLILVQLVTYVEIEISLRNMRKLKLRLNFT